MDEEPVIFRVPAHLSDSLRRFVVGDALINISLEPIGAPDGSTFLLHISDEKGVRN